MPLKVPSTVKLNPFQQVTHLISASPDKYTPPSIPTLLPSNEPIDVYLSKFKYNGRYGKEAKKALFSIDPDITFINHGSYGAIPKVVATIQRQWMDAMEYQPLEFMADLGERIVWSLRVLAKYLEVSPERIAYVENATAGVNTILRAVSRKLNKNDAILATSLGYDAVARTLEEISKLSGCKLVIVQIPLPSTRNEIVKRVQSALDHNPNVKLAIFDHITSASALILPLKELIGVCKRRDILTLIDGAHAIGHVPIDIGGLQPDFYVTNLHKWLFNPRGCAVLYIRNQELIDTYRIKPLVLSHGYNQGFLSEFYWTGTADYSRFLVVPSAIKFYEKLGGQELMERNHDLCLRAAHFLAHCFGTSLLVTDPTTIGCIAIIPTPPSLLQNKIITQTQTHPRATLPTSKESKKLDQLAKLPRLWYFATCLHDQLLYEYKIECMCVVVQGKLCVRISAQVYNDEDDYVRLAEVILKLSGINDRGSMESLTEMFKDGRILHLKNVLTKL